MEGSLLESPKIWIFPAVAYQLHQKTECPCPSLDHRPHIGKNVFKLRAFRQILPKVLPTASIFSNIIMINLEKFIGSKTLNTKQCSARLFSRIFLLNNLGKLSQQPKSYSFSPPEKSSIINLHLALWKMSFLCQSNCNFDLITLDKFHL